MSCNCAEYLALLGTTTMQMTEGGTTELIVMCCTFCKNITFEKATNSVDLVSNYLAQLDTKVINYNITEFFTDDDHTPLYEELDE